MKQQLLVQNVIVKLESHILQQLHEIISDPCFQQLVAAWIWLQEISYYSDFDVKIKILPIRLDEINTDFETASNLETSSLFEKLHLQEYEQAGGEPFGTLLIDFAFEFTHIKTLENFCKIAQQAFLPILYNLSNSCWGLGSNFKGQGQINFNELLQQAKYQQWRNLIHTNITMFSFAVLDTAVLTAMPCSLTVFANNFPIRAPSSYFLLRILLESYQKHNWFYDQKAASTQRLFTQSFWQQAANPNDPISKNILTATYSAQQIKDLLKSNILVLQQPFPNQELLCECARLMAMLALTRFAHYIKVILREVIGAYIDLEYVERSLAQFLNQYCAAQMQENSLLQYPLQFYQVKAHAKSQQSNKVNCQVALCLNGFTHQEIKWLIQ